MGTDHRKSFSFEKGVVVPIKYSDGGLMHSSINPHMETDLNSLSKLFICQDKKGAFHEEVISAFLDNMSGPGERF